MGNELPYKVDFGEPKLNLIIEKNNYYPEETINGYIMLKSCNFLKKGIINYKLFSKEMYTYKDNPKNLEKNKDNIIFEKSLKYPEIVDYSLTKGINIPFKLLIPKNIIPNFEYFLGKKQGFLRNFLQIEIPELSLKKQVFIIIKKPFNEKESSLSFINIKNINLFGIINKGSLSLSASFQKKCFSFFEKIPLEISIDNNSNNIIDIIKIDIKLLREITFKSKNDENNCKFKDILFENILNINKTLNNEIKNYKINTEVILEEPESLFNKYIIDPITYNCIYIRDKSNLLKIIPDIESDLFKCQYIISIECFYKCILKKENINLNFPISVYNGKNFCGDEKNKENILSNDKKNNEKIREDKIEIIEKNEKIKEPNTYTNLGNDDWNTPTKDGFISKVE